MKVKIKKVPGAKNGLQIEGNQAKPLSSDTLLLQGPSHAQGGIDINYMGNQVEAEGGEPVSTNNNGDLVVFGNMRIPGSKTKFKSAVKQIGIEEGKANKQSQKANNLISQSDPYNKYEALTFNSGLVQQDAANQKLNFANQQKELLGSIQNMMLQSSQMAGIEPKDWEKMMNGGKVKRKAQNGDLLAPFTSQPSILDQVFAPRQTPPVPATPKKLTPREQLGQQVRDAAEKYGIDPYLFEKQIYQESKFNPKARSSAGAIGIAQLVPGTAKDLGLSEAELNSTKPENVAKQIDAGAKYMSQLKDQFNGDETLALAAYNGGIGNIQKNLKTLSQRTGRPLDELTGKDWYDFMSKRSDLPEGQKETVNYYNNLVNVSPLDFWGDNGPVNDFYDTYYNPPEGQLTPQQFNKLRQQNYIPDITPLENAQISNLPISAPQANQISSDRLIQNQPLVNQQPQRIPSLADRNKLNPLDFLPEVAAILDRPDYVQGQQYNPSLLQPYRISLQDQINQNQSSFNALARNFTNNPEALAMLAAQNYSANQQVLGNEFRANQETANQIANQNTQILNDAQLRNIQLADQQYQRQAAALANTEANRNAALTSISNKYAQNRAENNNIRLLENMFQYRPDENLQLQNYNTTNFTSLPSNTPVIPQDTAAQTQMYKAQKAQADAQAAQSRAEKASKKNTFDFLNRLFR